MTDLRCSDLHPHLANTRCTRCDAWICNGCGEPGRRDERRTYADPIVPFMRCVKCRGAATREIP